MEKWEKREQKKRKERYGMRVSGRSVLTLQAVTLKKAKAAGKKGTK